MLVSRLLFVSLAFLLQLQYGLEVFLIFKLSYCNLGFQLLNYRRCFICGDVDYCGIQLVELCNAVECGLGKSFDFFRVLNRHVN